MEDDEPTTTPPSPVLTKKRFARKHSSSKPYKRAGDASVSPSRQVKSHNSCIPVPIKDHRDHSQTAHHVVDNQSSSSSSLTNFKQEVISNCAKTASQLHHLNASGGAAVPEGIFSKLDVRKGSENESRRNTKQRVHAQVMEVKCASGDVKEVPESHENQMDMLYENTKFALTQFSKSTVNGSYDSDEQAAFKEIAVCRSPTTSSDSACPVSSNHAISNADVGMPREMKSQMNYNIATDESSVQVLAKKSPTSSKIRRKLHSPLPPDVQVSRNIVSLNISPSMKDQISNWSPSKCDQLPADPFYGFTSEDVDCTDREFERARQMMEERLKLLPSSGAVAAASCVSLKTKSSARSKTNGTTPPKRDESISLLSNNQVQIRIGRTIKINIKSDNHGESTSEAVDEMSAESCNNAIEAQPVSSDEPKLEKKPDADNECTTSGYKSISDPNSSLKHVQVAAAPVSITNVAKPKPEASSSSASSCSFQSASGMNWKINKDALLKAAMKFADDVDMNLHAASPTKVMITSDLKCTTSSSPSDEGSIQSNGQLANRKILKAKTKRGSDSERERELQKTTSRKSLDFGNESAAESIVEFGKVPNFKFDFKPGFASASGKKINISENHLRNATAKYDEIAQESSHTINNSASEKHIDTKNDSLENNQAKEEEQKLENLGFSCASGKKVIINAESLKTATETYKQIDESVTLDPDVAESIKTSSKTAPELIEDAVQSCDKVLKRFSTVKPFRPPFKRLGTTGAWLPPITKEKLDKAKLLFEECDKNLNITPKRQLYGCRGSPAGFRSPMAASSPSAQTVRTTTASPTTNTCTPATTVTSTPCTTTTNTPDNTPRFIKRGFSFNNDVTPVKTGRFACNTSTPIANSTATSRHYRSLNLPELPFTPVRPSYNLCCACDKSSARSHPRQKDGALLFLQRSCSNFKELQQDIDIEYLNLKRKLAVLEERKIALENQKLIIDCRDSEHTRPRLGVLSRQKSQSGRVPLTKLDTPQDRIPCGVDASINLISPRNAEHIHFDANKMDNEAVVHTADGAVVIPNTRNTVGVTEISNAFQAMRGIDPTLIPKGWVLNHYKWIVWKLASYERRFPEHFQNQLTIESIVQQLKYRYDQEIDRARRPALRRILEKDDVPQKRMVLCVAEIIQVYNNKFELLLTDGWYAIRAVIDSLMCQQVSRGRLAVGTKLMIQNATLINCEEGCHPLEMPDNVKLQIRYNSTRRAAWHLRLGYYNIPTPFPVALRAVLPDGGTVAHVKLFVARIYPLRYMEEDDGVKIWRNAKAEEKRSAVFDSERLRKFDEIKEKVYDEFERHLKTNKNSPARFMDQKAVERCFCPKTLFELMETNKDPEGFYNALTPRQQDLLCDYRMKANLERHHELQAKIHQKMDSLRMVARTVTPILKLLVRDATEDSSECYVLNIWRPTPDQIAKLTEEQCYSFYNIVMKKTKEFNTVNKTKIEEHVGMRMKKAQRQVVPIAMIMDEFYQPMFNEFDTIGVVVFFAINNFDQELWLADFNGRLLYVKIVDGPKMCSLLDDVKIGQSVAVCNLILHAPHKKFAQAVANQYTSLTTSPSKKCFSDGMALFNEHIRNSTRLVKECKERVTAYRPLINLSKRNTHKSHHHQDATFANKVAEYMSVDDTYNENGTIPSGLTLTDMAMSLIDTDQFM